MINYVCGFAISRKDDLVLLIKKNRPDWQEGKLNGIGGHIEPNETPLGAMHREFREETGFQGRLTWHNFITLQYDHCTVYFFVAFCPLEVLTEAEQKSPTDEKVMVINMESLWYKETIPNLEWLIPMALEMYTDPKFRLI